MLVRLLIRFVLLALIIGVVAEVVPGIHVHGGFGSLLWIALIFSLVNLILGTILRLLSLPFIIVTFGLFLLVIDAALLGFTAWLTSDLDVDGFWSAVLGGFLIAIFSWLAELILPIRPRRRQVAS
ncbi:MAG TPA: phage holin family protein [Jatrophihabitantaceae bacterium]|jgi:putative membrane protein